MRYSLPRFISESVDSFAHRSYSDRLYDAYAPSDTVATSESNIIIIRCIYLGINESLFSVCIAVNHFMLQTTVFCLSHFYIDIGNANLHLYPLNTKKYSFLL